jgi:hypothetical protein
VREQPPPYEVLAALVVLLRQELADSRMRWLGSGMRWRGRGSGLPSLRPG